MTALGSKKGLGSKVKKFLGSKEGRGRGRSEKIEYGRILACLRKLDLLPAIFFLKSRADCDRALATCSNVKKPPEVERREVFGITLEQAARYLSNLRGIADRAIAKERTVFWG